MIAWVAAGAVYLAYGLLAVVDNGTAQTWGAVFAGLSVILWAVLRSRYRGSR